MRACVRCDTACWVAQPPPDGAGSGGGGGGGDRVGGGAGGGPAAADLASGVPGSDAETSDSSASHGDLSGESEED